MPEPPQAVIGGIGCRTDFHVAAALDPLGRVLGTESFPATVAGYRSTHRWLASFGPVAAVGVESTGSYGAALARSLSERGCGVIEVNQPQFMRFAHEHLRPRLPCLPDRAGCDKRPRHGAAMIAGVMGCLARERYSWHDDVWLADSIPVERGTSRETQRRSGPAGWAEYGYRASRSRYFWGPRLADRRRTRRNRRARRVRGTSEACGCTSSPLPRGCRSRSRRLLGHEVGRQTFGRQARSTPSQSRAPTTGTDILDVTRARVRRPRSRRHP